MSWAVLASDGDPELLWHRGRTLVWVTHTMKQLLQVFGAVVLISLLAGGCGSADSLEAAFQDAPSETCRILAAAVDADKAHDYLRAAVIYDLVLHLKVTPGQEKSVQTAICDLYTQMCKAAADGDPQAQRTLDQIREQRNAAW